MITRITLIIALCLSAASLRAQDQDPEAGAAASPPPVAATAPQPNKFDGAVSDAQQQLADSLKELTELRQRMAAETLPLSRKLSQAENRLADKRAEFQRVSRLLDSRTLDLSNLRIEIKRRQDEATYLSRLLTEYIRNFETGLHIAELQRYREVLRAANDAPEDASLTQKQIYQAQTDLVETTLDRLEEVLGGTQFKGTAIDEGGIQHAGQFLMMGPAALFKATDSDVVGTAEQRLGSLEPAIIPFEKPEDMQAAATVVGEGKGMFPLDPTLGNAHAIEATEDTLLEHIEKGGPVMVPIFTLAGAALLVALFKWLSLVFIRNPSRKRVEMLLDAVARKDRDAATRQAKAIGGPAGKMLMAGIEHLSEPRELIEEVMYEKVLSAKLKLQRLLPFIAISASSAPLLGLLGTVTGIINTFKLLTVFGSGDVKSLSSGISEALITTEFGLIVAIPSLLIHAFLSRKAKGIVDQMEKTAVSFVNQVSRTPYDPREDASRKQEADTQTQAEPQAPSADAQPGTA